MTFFDQTRQNGGETAEVFHAVNRLSEYGPLYCSEKYRKYLMPDLFKNRDRPHLHPRTPEISKSMLAMERLFSFTDQSCEGMTRSMGSSLTNQ